MRKNNFLMIAPLLLAGCTSGTNYNPNSVSKLHPGMTKQEVIAMLGKPNTVTTMPNGQTAMGWVHAKVSPFGASTRSVSLIFDENGNLLQTYQNQTDVK